MEEFYIRFSHDGTKYTGAVKPFVDGSIIWYEVVLLANEKTTTVKVVSRQDELGGLEWNFKEDNDNALRDNTDAEIVKKIGAEIEKTTE